MGKHMYNKLTGRSSKSKDIGGNPATGDYLNSQSQPELRVRQPQVHNLRHSFGRRLRGAGVPLETRKLLLSHANGDITTHYPRKSWIGT
jgi:integrase